MNHPGAASPCRLCLNPIVAASGIWLFSNEAIPPLQPADIIRQHFGIRVYKTDSGPHGAHPNESPFVCNTCWTLCVRFHQLHTYVQQHHITIEQCASVHCIEEDDDDGQKPTTSRTDIVAGVGGSAGIHDTMPQYKVEVEMVEDYVDEDYVDDDADEDDADADEDGGDAFAVKQEMDYEMDDQLDWPESRPNRTPPPSKPRKSTASTSKHSPNPNRKTPVKHSPGDIVQQDVHIREYFQMHCDHCDTGFAVLRDAIEHYRSDHQRRGYLKCCGKRFFNRTMILDHLRQHSDPKAFYCAPCDRTYCSQAALDLHLAKHDQQRERPFVCVVCGVAFLKQFQMRNHQRSKHYVSSGKAFGCDICGNWYTTKMMVSSHIQSVHTASHMCDSCGACFKAKSQLVEHVRRIHTGERKQKVQCGTCGALLADASNLRKHMQRHDQVAVACQLCGKLSPNQFSLNGHMRYVHGTQEFQCTMCEKSFKKAITLKEHMAIHMGIDLYSCNYCPRTFKSNANMFSHRKKEHPEEWNRDRAYRNRK